jgi:ABC-type phosphate transport system substrate-binding protein
VSGIRRKLVRLGVVAATSAALLALGGVGAGTAQAAIECGAGAPANIIGKGSSLQRVAQREWTGAYAAACPAGTKVGYTPTSSASALTAFRFNGVGSIESGGVEPEKGFTFVGTDEAPNVSQIENAENATAGAKAAGANPLIIPVAETSIAVIYHPPNLCNFKAGKTHGITWDALNEVFAGTLTKWSGFGAQVEGGASCEVSIVRVLPKEGSGTAFQFKNYLSKLQAEKGATGPGCSFTTWASLGEIGENEEPNITWPECKGRSEVVRKEGGGGEIAKYVQENADTIGFVALPDAKEKSALVARMKDSAVAEFAEPENGSASNCGTRIYKVPNTPVAGDGEGEGLDWSGVLGAEPTVGSELYPLCTLTYDIAWSSYGKAGYGVNAAEAARIAADAKKYITSYVLGEGQGAPLTAHYYQALPGPPLAAEFNVRGAAELAASKIN